MVNIPFSNDTVSYDYKLHLVQYFLKIPISRFSQSNLKSQAIKVEVKQKKNNTTSVASESVRTSRSVVF